MKKFKEYSGFNLSEINREMLNDWNGSRLFEQSMKLREGCPSFVFYEGPPSANGMPGIHHVMARTIKDIFCRYKTMKGFHVKRKAGWDTHGLPVELGVERSLGITKEDIGKKISVDEYNAACRREVMKFTREWETLTNSMGYWVDMNDPYITYDNRYIESVWWLLAQLYKKGLHHPALLSYGRHRSEFTRTEPAGMLPRRQGHHLHRAVRGSRSARKHERMGHSMFPCMDNHTLDTPIEHGSLRRTVDTLCHRADIQPLQRLARNSRSGRSSSLVRFRSEGGRTCA